MTDVKDLIDFLDRAYLAMNDAADELIELSLPATWQKKASDIADEINTLQQRIITRAELQQYIGWKTSAQIEYRRAEAADNMLLKAIARAEAAEAALAELQQLYNDRDQDLSFEHECAQKAEA